MLVSDALHSDNIISTGSSTEVHISPVNTPPTNTHQHLPTCHTMRLDVMKRDDVAPQSGAVDRCLNSGQVKCQRECSTWHQCTNRQQSVLWRAEEGGTPATSS